MSKDANGNGCGMKHFKLACWIIGLLLTVVVTITVAARAGQEERLRAEEQATASQSEQLKAIQRTLERIERRLEKGRTP